MANIKTGRTSGTSYVHFDWNGEEMSEALLRELEKELTPIAQAMEATAKGLCPVGKITRSGKKKSSKNRTPGQLRGTIKGTAVARKDKTALMVFLEAGDDKAFYAPFVELGTSKRPATPFIRPAFNKHKTAAIERINNAVNTIVNK